MLGHQSPRQITLLAAGITTVIVMAPALLLSVENGIMSAKSAVKIGNDLRKQLRESQGPTVMRILLATPDAFLHSLLKHMVGDLLMTTAGLCALHCLQLLVSLIFCDGRETERRSVPAFPAVDALKYFQYMPKDVLMGGITVAFPELAIPMLVNRALAVLDPCSMNALQEGQVVRAAAATIVAVGRATTDRPRAAIRAWQSTRYAFPTATDSKDVNAPASGSRRQASFPNVTTAGEKQSFCTVEEALAQKKLI